MNAIASSPSEILMDPMMDESSSFLQNPYPLFEQYRSRSTVCWSSRGNHWIVTGMQEAVQVLRDNNFGKRMELWRHPNPMISTLFHFLRSRNTGNMLLQDPPDHTRVRKLVQSAFLPATVRALEDHIQEITDNLIADVRPGASGDLIVQLAFPLPVTVIAELLGIPPSDRDQFKAWSTAVTSSLKGNVCPYRAFKSYQASRQLRDYLQKIVRLKRSQPANDLLSTLAQAQCEAGSRLSEVELLANSVLLLIAGHETTVNLIGNGMYHLLRHPKQKQLLLNNPQLINGAIEEFLRFDPPVQLVRRVAYKDVVLAGQKILPRGAITILIGACNRDPRLFDHPDQLDIERDNVKHLSFGGGIHYCLGAELARSEARIAVSTLLRKFPNIALKSPTMTYKAPFALRGLQALLVDY